MYKVKRHALVFYFFVFAKAEPRLQKPPKKKGKSHKRKRLNKTRLTKTNVSGAGGPFINMCIFLPKKKLLYLLICNFFFE